MSEQPVLSDEVLDKLRITDAEVLRKPDWRVTRAQSPEVVWARYADAIGLDEMRATFGEHWPPARARTGEEVYVRRDANLRPPKDPGAAPQPWWLDESEGGADGPTYLRP